MSVLDGAGTIPVLLVDATVGFDQTVSWKPPTITQVDLEKALSGLRPGIEKLIGFIGEFDVEGAQVEFGIQLTAGLAIIASGSAQVNFNVKLNIAKKGG